MRAEETATSSGGSSTGGGTRVSGSILGYEFDLRGAQAIVIAALLVVMALLIYTGAKFVEMVRVEMDHQGIQEITGAIESQTERQTGQHQEILAAVNANAGKTGEQHASIDEKMGRLGDALEVQNYLMLLDVQERKDIRARYKIPRQLRDYLADDAPRLRR